MQASYHDMHAVARVCVYMHECCSVASCEQSYACILFITASLLLPVTVCA
jgi:hypothetical protein